MFCLCLARRQQPLASRATRRGLSPLLGTGSENSPRFPCWIGRRANRIRAIGRIAKDGIVSLRGEIYSEIASLVQVENALVCPQIQSLGFAVSEQVLLLRNAWLVN